jgi:HK97 gp10 family phage protein
MANIGLKGGKEIQDFLNTLAPKLEQNIMRGALRAGAKVILDEAKQNVPVSSGDLRDSLRVSTSSKKGRVTASVKAGNKKVFYSRFIEFGVAAHTITSKTGYLSFLGNAYKSVEHPGLQPKPFLRPALDSKANEAINAVGDYIGKRLNKQGLNAPSLEVDEIER